MSIGPTAVPPFAPSLPSPAALPHAERRLRRGPARRARAHGVSAASRRAVVPPSRVILRTATPAHPPASVVRARTSRRAPTASRASRSCTRTRRARAPSRTACTSRLWRSCRRRRYSAPRSKARSSRRRCWCVTSPGPSGCRGAARSRGVRNGVALAASRALRACRPSSCRPPTRTPAPPPPPSPQASERAAGARDRADPADLYRTAKRMRLAPGDADATSGDDVDKLIETAMALHA